MLHINGKISEDEQVTPSINVLRGEVAVFRNSSFSEEFSASVVAEVGSTRRVAYCCAESG